MLRSRWQLNVVAFALVMAGACQSPTAPSGPDAIALVNIAPPDGTKLTAGGSVSITAALKYTLNDANRALIYWNSTDQSGRLLGHQPSTIVSRGHDSVTLSDQFSVPRTGVTQIRVAIIMTPESLISFGGGPEVDALYPVGP